LFGSLATGIQALVSLHPTELQVLVTALGRALVGAVVQKVASPRPLRVELDLRSPGRTARLVVAAEPGRTRLSVASARSPAAGPPSPWLLRLRKELIGARLVSLERTGAREVELRFEQKAAARTLVLEAEAAAALLLLGEERRPLAASSGRARPPRAPTPLPEREPPSRLPALDDALALGRAVEALFSSQEAVQRAGELRRQRVQPLRTRVERLRRTLEKVRAEANRTEVAEAHRRFGELLRQNASGVPRGASEVRLTEYRAEGELLVSVPLDPALDARAQAERHFRLYRRLTRGSARARLRLAELEGELAQAEAALAAVRAAPDTAFAAAAQTAGSPRPARVRKQVHQPYRAFQARSGEKILVGRAGRDNDALTFAVARPDDVWLHARGLPGAHVLIPCARGATVEDEVLLDAAHLALHHARGAGGDRGEVSYTRAKFVRRLKGGAPGAVVYTREKTILVRVEPRRLERLLASRERR
jgi:predicted ribosome quality control (RQC) complex YloA/Tae2 family protein